MFTAVLICDSSSFTVKLEKVLFCGTTFPVIALVYADNWVMNTHFLF